MSTAYQETLNYLFSQLPAFEKQGAQSYKPGLANSLALDEFCGHPHKQYKCIHVAGTNGKGSVSHTIASILQEQGYKVGLYTSPHLLDFSERIKVNGIGIDMKFVVDFTYSIRETANSLSCSFFELTSAMAFDYFAKMQVDFAVIEVGLGGRLDSTNIINPILSVITNISLDHTDLLGDSLSQIAREKAGIIKPLVPVVIGESNTDTQQVFSDAALQTSSSIYFADQLYQSQKLDNSFQNQVVQIIGDNKSLQLNLDLLGNYQLHNCITSYTAIEILINNGVIISEEAICNGFARVKENTGLLGRWHILNYEPLIVCDTAHNEAGIREVITQIIDVKASKIHIVWSNVRDKDLLNIVKLLPQDAHYYIAQLNMPRAMSIEKIKYCFDLAQLRYSEYLSLSHALNAAKQNAELTDLIFIGGSTFTVAEILTQAIV